LRGIVLAWGFLFGLSGGGLLRGARFRAPERVGSKLSAKSSRIDLTLTGLAPATAALGLNGTLLLISP
jgi:hypothetical protein